MLTRIYEKYFLVNPRDNSKEEIALWTYLRALEWMTWPEYVSQLFIPILFIFFDYKLVLFGLIFVTFNWIIFIRSNFLFMPFVAIPVPFVVLLKWPISLGVGVYFLIKHNYFLAAFSAMWPIWMMLIMFVPDVIAAKLERNKYGIGITQKKLVYLLGFDIDLNELNEDQNGLNKN